MAGYTRNDTSNNIATGNVINAADLDGEFDALVAAFHASTGHTHDGTAANGAPITKIGPAQDLVISTGAITPKTDNTVDLGSSSFEFKDLYIDGTANIDALVADTADINAGTIDGTTIGGSTAAAGSFTTLTTSSTVTLNGGTANGVLYLDGSKVATSGSALVFDGSNLGLGVTPSAWTAYKAFQIGLDGSVFADAGSSEMNIGQNVRYDGSFKYINTQAAGRYRLYNGQHAWFTAPSGTAGNAISFTQAMTLDANGDLTVGHTAALYPTSGRKTISINGSSQSLLGFGIAGAGKAYIGCTSSTYSMESESGLDVKLNAIGSNTVQFWTSNTERARITSGGDLLVGTTNSSVGTAVGCRIVDSGARLEVAKDASTNADVGLSQYSTGAAAYRFYVGYGGTVYATSTTITAISDQRLKENIRDLDAGLDKIMALKPRKFDWKAGKGKDIKGDRGWIAQEFEQVFPDMIDTWKDPAPEGEEPYKSVRADLIPVLVKAIQEQQALINDLRSRLAAAGI